MILKGTDGNLAVANLRHNNFDFATMQAQSRIDTYQGFGNIYYAGGWTHGSGLHEECWVQGEDVAALILAHGQSGAPQGPGKGKGCRNTCRRQASTQRIALKPGFVSRAVDPQQLRNAGPFDEEDLVPERVQLHQRLTQPRHGDTCLRRSCRFAVAAVIMRLAKRGAGQCQKETG